MNTLFTGLVDPSGKRSAPSLEYGPRPQDVPRAQFFSVRTSRPVKTYICQSMCNKKRCKNLIIPVELSCVWNGTKSAWNDTVNFLVTDCLATLVTQCQEIKFDVYQKEISTLNIQRIPAVPFSLNGDL